MNTPVMDFAPKAIATIMVCQEILAKYIEPTNRTTPEDCISELLGVLDDKKLVSELSKIKDDIDFST